MISCAKLSPMANKFPQVHILGSALVMLLAMWFSTGTLAPNALLSHWSPTVEKFPYLVNIDHPQWKAFFYFLNGDPAELWNKSVVLRRILHPVLSYPFWKAAGFEVGGVLANMVIQTVAFALVVVWGYRRWGRYAAITFAWLIATYPGTIYWSGLPYAYAFIVPGCLIAMILLVEIDEGSPRSRVLSLLGLGIVGLGYDFMPIFLPSSVLLLARHRLWAWIPFAAALIMLPSALWVFALNKVWGVKFMGGNTQVYWDVVSAYTKVPDWNAWLEILRRAPIVLIHNFFFSNMVVLPAIFIAMFVCPRFRHGAKLMPSEVVVLISMMVLWIFTNLAPPHQGWSMRGFKYARLYQPLFIVFLPFIARRIASGLALAGPEVSSKKSCIAITLAAIVMLNATIAFGPITRNPMSGIIYQEFYERSHKYFTMNQRLDTFGCRFLGR